MRSFVWPNKFPEPKKGVKTREKLGEEKVVVMGGGGYEMVVHEEKIFSGQSPFAPRWAAVKAFTAGESSRH